MRNRHILWVGICLLLALIPIINLVSILANTGVDTISNDYLMFVQQADRFLIGQNEWPAYFRDTLYNGVHSYAFLFPLRLLLLRISNLSIYAEIGAGLALAVGRLGLLFHLLTAFLPGNRRPWHNSPYLWLLPCLSALVFANAQISTFSYGETILQLGLTQLLILVGLTLLLQTPDHPLSAWGAALCGVLASFSGGSGLAAWPIFLLAMLWTNRRSVPRYAAWLLGLALAAWPYLAYSTFRTMENFQRPQAERLLVSLGLPFANNINYGLQSHSQASSHGLLGLLLAFITLGLLAWQRPHCFQRAAVPAVLLMAWSLLLSTQILLSRALIAPWYTTSYSLYWMGLLGLLPLFTGPNWPFRMVRLPLGELLLPVWGAVMLAVLTVLYGQTNLTYVDKSFYLSSRSPASAACLRNYHTAPTYCEGLVFQWSPGDPTLLQKAAQPLALNRLSVLGANQEWTLQGDYGLGRVTWQPDRQLGRVSWVRGRDDQPARWSDYHHLGVLIPPGQSIHWQLDLPAGIQNAQFVSALSMPAGAACQPGAASSIRLALQDQAGTTHPLWQEDDLCRANRQSIQVDLARFAGQRVTLMMTNTPLESEAPAARLDYPRLLLRGVPASLEASAAALPLNTDLSPEFPPIDASAYRLAVNSEAEWHFDYMARTPAGRFEKTSSSAAAHLAFPKPVCLASWSQFYLKAAMPDEYRRKWIQVRFIYQQPDGQRREEILDLTLLPGEALHTYSLNLDLGDFPLDTCLLSVDLLFNYTGQPDPALWVELPEAGFFPRH